MATDVVVSSGEEPDGEKPSKPTAFDRAPAKPGFFTIYKKGQGKWTRLGTAGAAALIGALTAYNLVQYLPIWGVTKNVAIGVATGFAVAFAVVIFYFCNKPSNVDFLIATDSEMKKVNWTTGNEIVGSTKVVIVFMFFVAFFLFAVDILFSQFFTLIGVLQTAGAAAK